LRKALPNCDIFPR